MPKFDHRLARLSPEQRRLVELWRRRRAEAVAPSPPPSPRIPRQPATDVRPLSVV